MYVSRYKSIHLDNQFIIEKHGSVEKMINLNNLM